MDLFYGSSGSGATTERPPLHEDLVKNTRIQNFYVNALKRMGAPVRI